MWLCLCVGPSWSTMSASLWALFLRRERVCLAVALALCCLKKAGPESLWSEVTLTVGGRGLVPGT